MESQFRSFLEGKTERKFPPNVEEERRKNTYPAICSESCVNHQCPYHNQDHYGQPCEAQWEPKENTKMNTQAPKNLNENLLRTLEKNLETALKPLADAYKRLEAIERKIREQEETPPHLNGENFTITRGVNQERINYD